MSSGSAAQEPIADVAQAQRQPGGAAQPRGMRRVVRLDQPIG